MFLERFMSAKTAQVPRRPVPLETPTSTHRQDFKIWGSSDPQNSSSTVLLFRGRKAGPAPSFRKLELGVHFRHSWNSRRWVDQQEVVIRVQHSTHDSHYWCSALVGRYAWPLCLLSRRPARYLYKTGHLEVEAVSSSTYAKYSICPICAYVYATVLLKSMSSVSFSAS